VAQAAIGSPPRPCPFIPIRSWTEAGRRVRRPSLQGIFFGGNPSGSGIGPERALEANKTNPSRGSAKADPSQSLLSERRHGPAERPHDHAHASPSAHGLKQDAGSGDPAYKGPFSGATRAAAGSGRSEPWRRTNPFPRAAARKLILPRASSASAGPVPRSTPTTTPIHPHPLMDRGRTPGQETRPTRDLLRGKPSGSGIGPERALEANKPIPSRGSAKADPSQSLLSERRPGPAERPKHAQRSGIGPERALEANTKNPSRGSAKADPSQSLLSERRHGPAEHPKHAQRSGIGPERALEANTKNPSRTARKLILPRASSASAGLIPRSTPNTPSGAGSVQSEPWRRTPKIPRAQRESSSSPEPPQRAQD
jgi:hypothetical protein